MLNQDVSGTNRITLLEIQEPSEPILEDKTSRKASSSKFYHVKHKLLSGSLLHYFIILILINITSFGLFFFLHKLKFQNIAKLFQFIFFEGVLAVLSLIIYKRTVAVSFKNLFSAKSRLIERILLIFVIILIFATHISFIFGIVPLPDDEPFTVTCYLLFGLWVHYGIFLFLFILIETISKLIIWLINKWIPALHFVVPVVRHKIFTCENLHTIMALLLALVLTFEGFYSTTSKPTIKNLNIKITDLPSEFENFSIAMVSDIHAGPSVGKQRVFEIVEAVNALNPNAIAIVGDFVDGYIKNMANRIEPFKNLKAKYGVYGALGNHEYFFEPVDNWVKYFSEELNITMLVNDAVILKKNDQELCFVGTDDYFADTVNIEGHGIDIEKSLSKCPTNISTIVMAHQPSGAAKVLREITRLHQKVDLILSGHTHAGQMFVTLPFTYTVNKYFFGHYFYAPTNTQIYVSSGINYWGPPLKMFPSLCEIVNIKLLKG